VIYTGRIITPANTLLTNVKKSELFVSKGLVYKIDVSFPAGSAGLLGVAIYDGTYQVWPSTGGQWFRGDGVTISFDDVYLKQDLPYKFDILTYNLDDTYAHEVDIKLGFVTSDIFMARFLPSVSYQFFSDMLTKLGVEQAALAAEQKQQIINSPFTGLINT
jgi:hypothetical protein